MDQSFKCVYQCVFLFYFRDEIQKDFADDHRILIMDGNVKIGHKWSFQMETDGLGKGRIIEDPERFDFVVFIHLIAGDDAFRSDEEIDFSRLFLDIEIAGDTDKNERDGHDRIVGDEGIEDDGSKDDDGS